MTEELHERVEADPLLGAAEKETGIRMCGTDDSATIDSYKPTVVRSLLRHDHFDAHRLWGLDEAETFTEVASMGDARERLSVIYGASGEIPVGCLTVKASPRSNDYQSSIVSHETFDGDVFTEGEDGN